MRFLSILSIFAVALVSAEQQIQASTIGDLITTLKSSTTCGSCEAVLTVAKGLAQISDQALVNVVQRLCKAFRAQDADVCDGAIEREGPIIAGALRKAKVGSRPFRVLCTTLMGVCGYPIEEWTVPMPPLPPYGLPISQPKPSREPSIQIVQFSDIHIDPRYETGARAECGKPICCRPYTVSDEPGHNDSPAGPFGEHTCDVPMTLEKSMYEAIVRLAPNAAFAIFTGDIVDHAIWDTTSAFNDKLIDQTYFSMNESLGKLPIYGTIGNHEASPANSFPADAPGRERPPVYGVIAHDWLPWIGPEAAAETAAIGAYSIKHGKNLRIISINTNIYYRYNFWTYYNMDEKDPNYQMAWLVQELDAAEKAGESVYIIGHMPPGEKDTLLDPSNYLNQIFNRYSSTIVSMFYGHTHLDEFEITYSNYEARTAENAKVMSYIVPSLTPTSGMPSFRIYDVDPVTYAVRDATTYFANMSHPEYQTVGPLWTKLYSAKEAYGQALHPPVTDPKADLTPAFWHDVTAAMETNDELFDAFISRKSRGWKPARCEGECKTQEICQLRAARSQDNCFKPKPGFYLERRRLSEEKGEHDDCGSSVAPSVFGEMFTDDENLKMFAKFAEEEMKKNNGKGH